MWKDLNKSEKEVLIKKVFPYEKIREIQKETIIDIVDNFLLENKKFIIMELPTGSGKSAIAMTVARILNFELGTTNTFLTASKQLQEQYLRDFKELVNITNSIDYECALSTVSGTPRDYHYGDENCKVASNSLCKMKCPYLKESNIWKSSNFRVTNFHFFGHLEKVSGEINQDDTFFNIYDEAHNLLGITISLSEINFKIFTLKNLKNIIEKNLNEIKIKGYPRDFNFNLINEIIKIVSTLYKSKNEDGLFEIKGNLKEEINKIYKNLFKETEEIKKFIDSLKEREISFDTEVFKMVSLLEILNKNFNILSYGGQFFIEKDEEENTIIIKPFNAKTAQKLFFRKGNLHLFLSATIGDEKIFTEELGIENYFFKRYDSIFPKENRPIYYLPICNFTFRNRETSIENISEFLNNLLPQFKNKRGVIHTSSYSNCEDIFNKLNSNSKERVKIPLNTKELKETLRDKNYDVLLSPILFEGADLKDDLAEFQVLTKIPFPSLGENYIKTKLKYNPKWYSYQTVLKIIQSYGRGVRHENDKCDFFILDSNFEKVRKYLPEWIKEAIED